MQKTGWQKLLMPKISARKQKVFDQVHKKGGITDKKFKSTGTKEEKEGKS
jgi:hypothetical protein